MLTERGVEKGRTRFQGGFSGGGVDCHGWRKGEPGEWKRVLGKTQWEVSLRAKVVESTD